MENEPLHDKERQKYDAHSHQKYPKNSALHQDAVGKLFKGLGVHVHLHKRQEPESKFAHFRHNLGKFLESPKVQYTIVGLTLLDVIILVVELTLEREFGHTGTVATVEEALYWLTVAILVVFLVELLLLMVAFGWKFFTHVLYVIDLIIIVAAFVLEVVFREELSGFLTIIRLWRLLRIAHGIVLAEEERHKHTKEELHEEKAKVSALQKEVEELKKTIAYMSSSSQ